MVVHEVIGIQSDRRPTFHDITDQVADMVGKSGIKDGSVLVYSQHTTCSVLIQEQSDDVTYHGTQLILQDLVNVLTGLVPTCLTEGQYLHPGPKHIEIAGRERNEEAFWSLNTDAHLRSVIMGRSETVPVVDGNMNFGGVWQDLFCGF